MKRMLLVDDWSRKPLWEMEMKCWAGAVPVALSLLCTTNAAGSCEEMADSQLTTRSIESLLADVKKLPLTKDEFETTEAHSNRLQEAIAPLTTAIWIQSPVDEEFAPYNADTARFEIFEYAINNRRVDYSYVFGRGEGAKLGVSYSSPDHNLDVVVNRADTPVGTYAGRNAFGAEFVVTEVQRQTSVIFERKGEKFNESLFFAPRSASDFSPRPPIAYIESAPDDARRLRGAMKAALLISLKAPYYAMGSKTWPAKIDDPREVVETIEVLIADIRCVAITDAEGRVFATRSTR